MNGFLTDSISLVYDFGTPMHFYCIVEEKYEKTICPKSRERLGRFVMHDLLQNSD